MKVTPWSMALRMILTASSALSTRPRWEPPKPMMETLSPVLPRGR
jgi:hypothetical protein